MSTLRGYLTQAELEEYADITITDPVEADDQITQAEEIIDVYVGYQQKFMGEQILRGTVSAVSNSDKTFTDTSNNSQLGQLNNYFAGAVLEIVGGTGAGQIERIASSDKTTKSVTIVTAFSVTPNTTSVFRIYQMAKFPRYKDVVVSSDGLTYYKVVPRAVQQATAAQVQYMINMGTDYFSDNSTDAQSESIGNYSYSNGGASGQSSSVKMIAPKARTLLRGIMNRGGRIDAGNPTCL